MIRSCMGVCLDCLFYGEASVSYILSRQAAIAIPYQMPAKETKAAPTLKQLGTSFWNFLPLKSFRSCSARNQEGSGGIMARRRDPGACILTESVRFLGTGVGRFLGTGAVFIGMMTLDECAIVAETEVLELDAEAS